MTPFRIVLIFSFVSLLGLATMRKLSLDYIPATDSPSFTIDVQYPGKPPLLVEQEVINPLENYLSQLDEIQSIRSVSNYGNGHIELRFYPNIDLTFKEIELLALIRQVKSKLPPEAPFPSVSRRSKEDQEKMPLMIYELVYEGDDLAVNSWLQNYLLPRFSSLSGIESVIPTGYQNYAWKVLLDSKKLQRLGITRDLVWLRMKESVGALELGLYEAEAFYVPLRYEYDLKSSQDLIGLNIMDDIQLGDVATVEFVPDRVRSYQRVNGKSAIFLNFIPHEGVNRLQAAQEIRTLIQDLSSDLPSGYSMLLNYDDTEFLVQELDKTWLRAALSLLVISFFILYLGRNWKYLIILVSSIVVCVAWSSAAAYLLSVQIHLYTLAGITLAAGIIVDNAIILIDHLKKNGNLSILSAQLSSTLTTIAALLIVFALPDEYRQELTDFVMIVSLALAISFFTSWWYVPALARLLGFVGVPNQEVIPFSRKRRAINNLRSYLRFLRMIGRYRWGMIGLCILVFGIPIFLLPTKWEGQDWYNETIGSDAYQEEIRPHVDRWMGGSLRMFYQDVYERSSHRTPEKTRLYLRARLPYGHTLQQMNTLIMPAEEYLKDIGGIEKFVTQIYSPRNALIVVDFERNAENVSFPLQLKNRLIQRSLDWGGVTWSVYGIGRGFHNSAGSSVPNFNITLKGYHYKKLETIAHQLAQRLLTSRRIEEVNTDAHLRDDQEGYTRYHFVPLVRQQPFYEYMTTLRQLQSEAIQDVPSLYVNNDDQYFPLYLEAKEAADLTIHKILYKGDNKVALSNFGALKKVESPDAIHKEDRQYIRQVAFDYLGNQLDGNYYLNDVLEEIKAELPPGFSVERKQWSWLWDSEKSRYELVLVLIVIVFFIGSIFLESIKEACYLVLTIPLSFIGLFLVFGWGGFSFDQGGYAAFLLIGGLSVNALLYVLSDYKNYLKKHPHNKALMRALYQKAWPIVLTVISTCAGLIPFLIHGDDEVFWFSFAIGTIGGMVFSLLVVFFILPGLMTERN